VAEATGAQRHRRSPHPQRHRPQLRQHATAVGEQGIPRRTRGVQKVRCPMHAPRGARRRLSALRSAWCTHMHECHACACRIRDEGGRPAFIAGGAVRDLLLGLEPTDYDIAAGLGTGKLLQLFPEGRQMRNNVGTVEVVLPSGQKFEITPLRNFGPAQQRHFWTINRARCAMLMPAWSALQASCMRMHVHACAVPDSARAVQRSAMPRCLWQQCSLTCMRVLQRRCWPRLHCQQHAPRPAGSPHRGRERRLGWPAELPAGCRVHAHLVPY
jgi:Poly A polymerase head domain